jgi:ribosome biogenesis GTPase A
MPNFWKVVNDVIEKSDIVIEVLDARMVQATRNEELESKVHAKGKKLLYLINKCDLVDKDYVEKQKKLLRPALFISAKDHLGTTMLKTKLLEMSHGKHAVIGVVGYPNTGKSSIINSLSGQRKAKTSPFSGFTKGMQKIRAGKVTLIDTPGVIPFSEDDEYKHSIIGAVDPSRIKDPEYVVMRLIEEEPGILQKYYGVESQDAETALEQIAVKLGRIKSGAEPDTETASRMVIKDWQRGKITVLRS